MFLDYFKIQILLLFEVKCLCTGCIYCIYIYIILYKKCVVRDILFWNYQITYILLTGVVHCSEVFWNYYLKKSVFLQCRSAVSRERTCWNKMYKLFGCAPDSKRTVTESVFLHVHRHVQIYKSRACDWEILATGVCVLAIVHTIY